MSILFFYLKKKKQNKNKTLSIQNHIYIYPSLFLFVRVNRLYYFKNETPVKKARNNIYEKRCSKGKTSHRYPTIRNFDIQVRFSIILNPLDQSIYIRIRLHTERVS